MRHDYCSDSSGVNMTDWNYPMQHGNLGKLILAGNIYDIKPSFCKPYVEKITGLINEVGGFSVKRIREIALLS